MRCGRAAWAQRVVRTGLGLLLAACSPGQGRHWTATEGSAVRDDAGVVSDSGGLDAEAAPRPDGKTTEPSVTPDGGKSTDMATASDGGAPGDPGARPDAAAPHDPEADSPQAGMSADTGTPQEPAMTPEAGTPPDASRASDASMPMDGSTPPDKGTPPDTGRPQDASAPSDAGAPTDASARRDAGAPKDEEPPPDTGTPPSSGRVACETLSRLSLPDANVTRAVEVAATDEAPEHCDVQLAVSTAGSSESIRVGVFLPTATWNGRFVGTGGAGLVSGDPSVPCGIMANGFAYEPCALKHGYATASTDAGLPQSADFVLNADGSLNWSRIERFGHLGIHVMATTAKAVIAAYYGSGPLYAYFLGGSAGGRQALLEAQRHPTDFDGIAAQVPAIHWTKVLPASLWPQLVMQWADNFLPQSKLEAINEATIAACDALDGLEDGIISAWRECDLDARDLVGLASPAGTVHLGDAEVVNRIWQGPRGIDGEFLWYGLVRGTPFGGPSSQLGGLANTDTWGQNTYPVPYEVATQWFSYWLAKDRDFEWRELTHAQFVTYFEQSVTELSDATAADDPDLTEFRAAGGKLLFWHGTADELVFPQGPVAYYDRVVQTMGGLEATRQFARFFLAPGANHLGSWAGPGPRGFLDATPIPGTAFGAIVDWVEAGEAPEELLGVMTDSEGEVVMTRPVCLYPRAPRHTGSGSIYEAQNFVCSD